MYLFKENVYITEDSISLLQWPWSTFFNLASCSNLIENFFFSLTSHLPQTSCLNFFNIPTEFLRCYRRCSLLREDFHAWYSLHYSYMSNVWSAVLSLNCPWIVVDKDRFCRRFTGSLIFNISTHILVVNQGLKPHISSCTRNVNGIDYHTSLFMECAFISSCTKRWSNQLRWGYDNVPYGG